MMMKNGLLRQHVSCNPRYIVGRYKIVKSAWFNYLYKRLPIFFESLSEGSSFLNVFCKRVDSDPFNVGKKKQISVGEKEKNRHETEGDTGENIDAAAVSIERSQQHLLMESKRRTYFINEKSLWHCEDSQEMF